MITIKLDFPASRWHATAWGSHVNEGVPEWPPCPWRLCRALLAAWHVKHRQEEPTLRTLIDKLASQLPTYHLPTASAAHTRHYMPVVEGKKETKTKIFDTFVHVNEGESLWIRWDIELSASEHTLLATLLSSLSYLGRAESLVIATLVPPVGVPALAGSNPTHSPHSWTTPSLLSNHKDGEPVRLLAPLTPQAYAAWLASQTEAGSSKGKGKKKSTLLPATIFDALQTDTANWKKEGWNLPPGSHWVEYTRPANCFKIAPVAAPKFHREKPLPTVARFALVSTVPPSITQALSLSERFHKALCSRTDVNNSALTGCGDDRKPLNGHGHVYYLPECDKHGYVTHMTLHAREGFDAEACRVLRKLRKVWGMEGFDVKIVLLAIGSAEEFAIASPYFHRAKTWESLTPFVPVRHAKATRAGAIKVDIQNNLQIGSPAHDCWRLIKALDSELPIENVELIDGIGTRIHHELRDIPCLDFQRNRRNGEGTRASNRGYALRVNFSQEVCLPYGFGYAAHFGLGLFSPVGVPASAGSKPIHTTNKE